MFRSGTKATETNRSAKNLIMRRLVSATLLTICLALFCQTALGGWVKQRVNTFAWLQGVYFLNENKGWIVGSRGTILATADGGTTWDKLKTGTNDTIRDVYFFDEQNGIVLVERDRYQLNDSAPSYLMKTTNGGGTWEAVEIGAAGSPMLVNLFFDKEQRGWAVGEAGAVFSMEDRQNSWRKHKSPSVFAMMDGAFSDDLNGCLVGGGGTILFTEDGGLLWNISTVFGKSETKLNSIVFTDSRNGWTVGSQGKIYVTTNGGKSWRAQTTAVTSDLYDVAFTGNGEGWAVGANGTLLRTQSAGRVWASVPSGVPHKLERVFFTSPNRGWIVGFGGTVLKYQN
jgi:photosystem II stability/assembly factor-like uncharacterized protein